jgi:hypothetical protein
VLGSAPCSKNIGVRPIKWLLLEEVLPYIYGHNPPLIDRSMNKYPQLINVLFKPLSLAYDNNGKEHK